MAETALGSRGISGRLVGPFDQQVGDERLVGLVNLRQLVVSKPDSPVRDVMETDLMTVGVDTDQEVVADVASRYDVVAVPVVDAKHRLLGVVEIDDLVEFMLTLTGQPVADELTINTAK